MTVEEQERCEVEIDFNLGNPYALDQFLGAVLASAQRAFEKPEVQAKYAAWHLEKYGYLPSGGG